MLREAQLTHCAHCGTPFTPKQADERFCCQGCHYVSQVLHDDGLERFYELKGDKSLPPVGSKVFQDAHTAWLETVQETAENSGHERVASTELNIEGISCLGCVWLIEAVFKRQTGSSNIRIDPRTSTVGISWIPARFDLAEFARSLQQIGYRLAPYSASSQPNDGTRQLSFRLGICAFFLLNTMLFTLPGYLGMAGDFFLAPIFQMLGALFATLSLVVGGGYFILRAWKALQNKVLHIDLPIALGLLAAYAGSMIGVATGYASLIYFDFVATFVFLMLVGRWLQEFALSHNRAQLQKQHTGPREVTRIGGSDDGRRVSVAEIKAQDRYSVNPGEVNPVAAELQDPLGNLSLEWINGEADPVVWKPQRTVPAGAINVGLHALNFQAKESWKQSLLAQLLERTEDDFSNQRLQQTLKWYIGTVIAIAALGGIGWIALTGHVLQATQVLISVLVVSCPCALGIALPMCDEFANARLRRAGLFIKSDDIWERIRQVNTVVFDKTGTLTMDVPRLLNPERIHALDPLSAQALFVMVEHNVHPVARSLREHLMATYPQIARETHQDANRLSLEENIGNGVSWIDPAGNQWSLGKPAWMPKTQGHSIPQIPQDAHTVLRQNGLLVAAFNFAEDVRDDATEALQQIHHHQLSTAILSGDAHHRVTAIAEQLKLPENSVRAECSPTDKADWIAANAPHSALMIGDGANDSLAFDQAICRGTPVVDRSILESSADFFFFGRSLRSLPILLQTARARRRTVATVFATAVCYNIVAVTLCLAGLMHPLMAAILMPLSSIVTLLISWIGLKSTN